VKPKHNKGLLAKLLLLLAILLVCGLTFLGCVRGLQPIGWSGGVIADDTLFIGSKEGRLVAINTADGSSQWSEPLRAAPSGGFGCMPTGGGGCAPPPSGVAIYGTPAVSGDLAYIGGYNGKIYAFNANSLQLRWVYPREDYLKPIIGGPTVALNTVYFGTSSGKVFALDAATGDKEWEFQTDDEIWSTPAIDGDTLFIGSFDKKLYALNAADGSQKWEPFETKGAIVSTPLVYNGIVYIGSFDRHLYAVDAATGKQIWQFPVTDEDVNKPDSWFWAKPIAYSDIVYAGCLDHKVYALNAENGDKVAEFDLGSPVSPSPVLVNSSIIFASQQGVIYAFDTGSNKLKQLADIEEEIYGPLCAIKGIVYIRAQKTGGGLGCTPPPTESKLIALNAQTGAELMTILLEKEE
jgi:outer membrane protein assembly factor BamB